LQCSCVALKTPLVAIVTYAYKCRIRALVLCYGEPAELLSFPSCQWLVTLVDVPAEPESATLFTRNVIELVEES
jgi:hypothetical protein